MLMRKRGCFLNNSHALLCLLYTSDAADDSLRVDLGGRRIIKKKNKKPNYARAKGGGERESFPCMSLGGSRP